MKQQISSKSTKLGLTQIYNKTYKHQTVILQEMADQISPLLKKHIKLGHAGIMDFHLIINQIINFITIFF